MKTLRFFAITILAAALFAGCSDSTTPQEAQSASDTFRQYSANLHELEFRQALRNSWVGTSETSKTRVRGQAGFLLDMGKKIGGDLIKKGLSYGIDKAFGIQSKSQKEAKEINFINHSLLGIQHQLTAIQDNLTDVYNNQIKEMQQQGKDQLEIISDFSDVETEIIKQSSAAQTFNASYSTFIDDLQNTTNGKPDYELDLTKMCDPTSDFLSNNYGNLDENYRHNTILYDAYQMVNDLFGSSETTGTWVDDLSTDADQYMTQLITATTGCNVVANYYAAGTSVSQAAYAMADLLQRAYTVFAFTLQFASECDAVKKFYSGQDSYPGNIYANITISTLTSENLPDALNQLATNFNTQFFDNAMDDFEKIAEPFVTYGGTDNKYWDTAKLLTAAGLNLADDFIQNGCFPLSYVKNVNNNGNLDYLAAECNYNDQWTVLQLFIPTNNGTEGMTNISYLSGFGLIGDMVYDPLSGFLSQAEGTIFSAGTCDVHYKHWCTSGFSDCGVTQASIQLETGVQPLYGADQLLTWVDGGYFYEEVGLDYRYIFSTYTCENADPPDNTCDVLSGAITITPNGHVFWGSLESTWCRNEINHDLFNSTVDFGMGAITEGNASVDNSTLSYPDGTQITAIGPSNNAANQNGNNTEWAEYGFGMSLANSPQPDAKSYPICAHGTTISLASFYSYSDNNNLTGTVKTATTIDVNGKTGTFDDTYKSLTLNGKKWKRVTSSNDEGVGTDAMQGLWVYGSSGQQEYMTTSCSDPTN